MALWRLCRSFTALAFTSPFSDFDVFVFRPRAPKSPGGKNLNEGRVQRLSRRCDTYKSFSIKKKEIFKFKEKEIKNIDITNIDL